MHACAIESSFQVGTQTFNVEIYHVSPSDMMKPLSPLHNAPANAWADLSPSNPKPRIGVVSFTMWGSHLTIVNYKSGH